MVNTCELLINVVKANRLKLLKSLNQNGVQSVNPLYQWDYTDNMTAGEETGPKPSIMLIKWNVVSPYICIKCKAIRKKSR